MLNPKNTKKYRQYLRNNMTKWEVILWNDLKGKKMFGFKVRRQYGFRNYVIDFYCPRLKLAIEIDGDVHYFENNRIRDQKKDEYLQNEGIKMIRLKNEDLDGDYESVITYLENLFKKRANEMNVEINDFPK